MEAQPFALVRIPWRAHLDDARRIVSRAAQVSAQRATAEGAAVAQRIADEPLRYTPEAAHGALVACVLVGATVADDFANPLLATFNSNHGKRRALLLTSREEAAAFGRALARLAVLAVPVEQLPFPLIERAARIAEKLQPEWDAGSAETLAEQLVDAALDACSSASLAVAAARELAPTLAVAAVLLANPESDARPDAKLARRTAVEVLTDRLLAAAKADLEA